jgi:MFS family permease
MLTDRFGRKKMILWGLISSALTSLSFIFINDFSLVYILGIWIGLFASIGGPAQSAIIADLLPEEKHAEGYGIWRVNMNLTVAIAPLIGAWIISYSFAYIFIIDAVTSVITATILFFALTESMPQPVTENTPANEAGESTEKPKKSVGYGKILRDLPFMAFVMITMLMVLVYMQMNNTLPVYLRDVRNVSVRGFGYIISLNAAMVVFMQFWITRKIRGQSPFKMLSVGTFLYAIGFLMYALVSEFALYMVAMVIITLGEMLTAPVGQALVARFSPADMRGRYMAIYGFAWAIPSATGLIFAGVVFKYLDPNWIWYLCAILGTITAGGFLWIERFASEEQPEEASSENPDMTLEPALA